MKNLFKSIFIQFKSYSLIGLVSVSLDMFFYVLLSEIFLISKSSSKIISFIIGSINSFLGNKIITFKRREFNLKEPIKFIFLYTVSLTVNSKTHDFLLEKSDGFEPFIIATIISVIINFSGQKFWVFKNR